MLTQQLVDTDSMLGSVADPQRALAMLAVREAIRQWRFYKHFGTDSDAQARTAQGGTFTPVLHHNGSNLASLETIIEGQLDNAMPGSPLYVEESAGRFELQLQQHRLLRPLAAAELSNGTLRYLVDSGSADRSAA